MIIIRQFWFESIKRVNFNHIQNIVANNWKTQMKSTFVLGGYGNFGQMICKGLVQNGIPLIIGGRTNTKVQQYVQHLRSTNTKAEVHGVVVDANKNLKKYLELYRPTVVINTCGPFLPFQSINFKVIQDCIDSKVNYIDLSDGRQYIRQILKFNDKAKQVKITAITGASTAPGLSSALIQKYIPEFTKIESIHYGFSPGQKSTRGGQATAKGVMSYVGKKIQPYGQIGKSKYGWQDIYGQYYPGVGYRLMGNVDHPDFDIFSRKYGLTNFHFHAGVESKFLHLGIWVSSWLVRLGVPLNLTKHAGSLLNVSHHLFDWMGSDVGVMHMKIRGQNKQGKRVKKRWFLIARGGDGPNVATVPAILLATRICKQEFKLEGVHACAGLVSLEDYINYLKKFNIQIFTEQSQL